MNIYNELDYRDILKKTIEERKKIDSSITYQAMATYTRIQKAYLSQVINVHILRCVIIGNDNHYQFTVNDNQYQKKKGKL